MIGHMDASTVFTYLHEGAVYLHKANRFSWIGSTSKRKVAHVSPKVTNYYTRALSSEKSFGR